MATIEKLTGKTGTTYRITVYSGFDTQGKRIRHRQTYKPDPSMTPRQVEKAVQRAATDFERSIEQGFVLDNRQTFADYAAYVLDLKERSGTKSKTLDRYRELMGRINQAIGHMKLADIRPQHLNSFYKNLSGPGIRETGGIAMAKIDLAAWLKANKKSRASIARAAGVAASTVSAAAQGQPIQEAKAEAIAQAMGKRLGDVFTVEYDMEPLSDRTVLAYHRLISIILAQAEKEMLVPYNAAAKATPPKAAKKAPNYFQPETITEILKALEAEPLKWQLITHLLLVTGCRRGEIMGLKWDKVDFKENRVKIDSELIISKSKGVHESTTKTSDIRGRKACRCQHPAAPGQICDCCAFASGCRAERFDGLAVPARAGSGTWAELFHGLPHCPVRNTAHRIAMIVSRETMDLAASGMFHVKHSGSAERKE